MIPTLSFWITLIGRLAVEAGLLVALAAAAQPWVATPWRRRALWQTALLGIALAWAAELGGWRQEVLRRWPESRPKAQVMVRTTMEAMPGFDFAPVVVSPPPVRTSPPITAPKAVWWPLQLWAVGTLLLGLRALSVRVWLLLAALRRSRVGDAQVLARVEALQARVGLSRVRVVSWPGLLSPIAFGWWTPTIALPTDFTVRFDDEAQEAILAHELAHLSARDPLWLGVADAVLALAWWHPAVWWSRHQLRAACESAADDASALIPGGRVRLAELLVVLGRDLVSPGWTRGLGVAGDGFKSQLARRVTTLLRATHDWRADRSARLVWTRVLALGVTALLVAFPWPGNSGPALTALIQEARANAAESKAKPTSATPRFVPVIGYSKAYSAPRSAVANELTNAMRYEVYDPLHGRAGEAGQSMSVGLSSSNWLPAGSSTYVSAREPSSTTNPLSPPASSGSPGKARINTQLNQIILPKFDLEPMPVTEAILDLVAAASRFDPEKRGVDIRLLNNAEFIDADTGTGIAAIPSLRTGISVRDTTVRAALNSIVEASSQPLVWRVDEYAVVVSPAPRLYTRSFRLNAEKFVKVLQPFLKAGSTNLQDGVRAFFLTNGVTLGEMKGAGTPQQDQSAIFFQPRSGVLFVRASLNDLDKTEKILQRHDWGTSPGGVTPAASNAATSARKPIVESSSSGTLQNSVAPEDLLERIRKIDVRLRELRSRYNEGHPKVQEAIAERMALVGGASAGATNRMVKMEVKLVVVRETGSSGLGLDWVFGPAQTNQVAASEGSSLAAEETRNENYHVDLFRTANEVATINGTQFAALIKRLEDEDGKEVLSTPSVLTENGRQSVVSVTEEVSMVDGVNAVPGSVTNQAQIRYNTSKVPVGPSVEMLPVFVGDSLRMHIRAKITEFQGYDQPKPGQSVQTTDAKGKKIEGIQPLPHLRVRVAVADPVLRRGETAVLRGPVVTETVRVKDKVPVLGDVPLLGRLFRSESTSTYKKRLYVFVTPTEMDAAGNPK